MNRSTLVFRMLLPLFLIMAWGCRQERRATPIPSEVNPYVYAYTSGMISKTSAIRVQFTRDVAIQKVGQTEEERILSFSPAVAGIAIWEDARTLRFDPSQPLASGATYIATVQLGKLIDGLPRSASSFEFDFKTREQYFEVQFDGLYAPDPNQLTVQEARGQVYTSDYAESAAVENLLEARQKGEKLPVRWVHSADQQAHRFYVERVNRAETTGQLRLNWDGSPLDLQKRESMTIDIPAIGDFKVSRAQVIQDNEQYILLHFSDPLEETQRLEGLINLSGYQGESRYIIEGQDLRWYPAQRITGRQTLTVSPGIRNASGRRMTTPSQWQLTFEEAKPQLRLVGNGVIMPNSEGLLFPFEAIGLHAVEVEIFKIHHSNILQFLQDNNLYGNNQLFRVGRVILQQKVSLQSLNPGSSSRQWTRYALDMNKLINQDPDAIYQVRIGFRPAYALYYCGEEGITGAGEEGLSQQIPSDADDWEEVESIMDSWYGIEGYYPEYRWEQRDDPCYPAYYNSDRFIRRNVLVSNLGIIAKGGESREYQVVVTDLRNALPVANATVELYDFQQQLVGTGKTDQEGISRILAERKPYVALARLGGEEGYLRLGDGDALSMGRFEVDGVQRQRGIKGFLYAERGVWRPGDSIYLNFVLDDPNERLPADYPITFELYDPRGRLQQKWTTSRNTDNIYPLHTATAPDAPTGNWAANVQVGGAVFDKSLQIETVKPNRLEIDLSFASETLQRQEEPLNARLQSRWLHGAPARGLDARVEVQLNAANTSFEAFSRFEFDDPARPVATSPRVIFDGNLNKEGVARFNARLFGQGEAPGVLRANFRSRVFERSGEFSITTQSRTYYPYPQYAGVAIPENNYGIKRLTLDSPSELEFALVDRKGKPLANRRLEVGLYRVEWRWWYDQGGDNVSRFSSASHTQAERTTVLTTDDRGIARWPITVDQWGRYLIRVCDPRGGHCGGDFFTAGSPWSGDQPQDRQAAAMLNFRSDKARYAVGETVELTIPTSDSGRALISLETGAGVLESHWIDTESGETTFRFKATPAMAPNVYANVSLLQPHGQRQNDLPIRMYGLLPILVDDPGTRLQPEVKVAESLKPQEKFTVAVSEAEGKPMAYTIAVVDEGLLGLTGFTTPDPHASIYAKEALELKSWDVYDQVLGAYGGRLQRLLSIGGDAAEKAALQKGQANRFEPVAMHLGPFHLDRRQSATHELNMPNYVGAVRTMVVAVQDGAYGKTDQRSQVEQPLMALATLPRLIAPGERVKLPVNLFAGDESVRQVSVEVSESSGLVRFTGPNSKTVTFEEPGQGLVEFELEVAESIGIAQFDIQASSGSHRSSQQIELEIRNPNPYTSTVLARSLGPNETWAPEFSPVGMAGTNTAVLEVSSVPPLNLGERLKFLMQYPYGCIEQSISAGFPQLYVDQLLELDPERQETVRDNIEATLERLKKFQTGQGGFAYWPGGASPDHWSTSYAGHFMLEAQRKGYPLPAGMLDQWQSFQQKVSRMWNPNLVEYGFNSRRGDQLSQAYRLFTLALAGAPDLAAMNRLRENNDLTLTARWRLAAAYAVNGQAETANQLIGGQSTQVDDYQEMAYTYGSSLRDRAMILETLVLMNEKDRATELAREISQALNRDSWYSTQTTAFALLAMSRYVAENPVADQLTFTYQTSGKAAVNAGSNTPLLQIDLPLQRGGNTLQLTNTSGGRLFTRVILRGQPLTGAEQARANNLNVQVNYKTMNGDPLDPQRITQGSDFIAEVTVIHPGSRRTTYREMALAQVFPSGWEILNTRMDGLQAYAPNSPADYQDIRDDRVLTFFDLGAGQSHTYRVQLNAAYQGRFYLPAVSCEAMYDNTVAAQRPGQWVEVVSGADVY